MDQVSWPSRSPELGPGQKPACLVPPLSVSVLYKTLIKITHSQDMCDHLMVPVRVRNHEMSEEYMSHSVVCFIKWVTIRSI